ncbi:MAG: hypothetical protein U5L09_22340 [Bacteroidales bacterium]|nr:hypothetical protein [Bacteroidales bacterium]
MKLFEQKQKYEEIDFDKIQKQISEIVHSFYRSQHCDKIDMIDSLIEIEKVIIDKRGKNKNRIEEYIFEI